MARDGADGFSPVFTSPLIRAAEGARIIAGEDAAVITIEELVEVDFGLFEGLTADEIAEPDWRRFVDTLRGTAAH
jgi:broad specificity phosphatase PhoE